MRFNFKKISAIAISTLMTGMTMGVAAAASYPTPFVSGGVASGTAVVYGTGTGVSALDQQYAGAIQTDLQKYVTSTGGSVTVEGESVQISAAGNDLTYGEPLKNVREKITKSNLPTLLADGKIRTGSSTIDYEQWIETGAHGVTFGDLNDEENYVANTNLAEDIRPVLYINTTANAAWTLVVKFDSAMNFSNVRDGETLTIAGKDYTVAKDLKDADDLVLYASAQTEVVGVGEVKTITAAGETYTIEVVGANTDADTATIILNGKQLQVEEGDTEWVGDQKFYINRVFMQTVPTPTASVEVFVGAEELNLGNTGASTVEINDEEIDGMVATITGADIGKITQISFAFTPSDLDADTEEADYLEIGETVYDPVFGTIGLVFESASMDLMDSAKEVINFRRTSNHLEMSFNNREGNAYKLLPVSDNKTDADYIQWHDNFYINNSVNLTKNDIILMQEGTTTKNFITRAVKVTSTKSDEITFRDESTGATTTRKHGERIWSTTTADGAAGAYACNNVTITYNETGDADPAKDLILEGWFLGTTPGCSYDISHASVTNTTAEAIAYAGTNYLYNISSIYTENNARIDIIPTAVGYMNVTEQYDETPSFNVSFEGDTTKKGEFNIDIGVPSAAVGGGSDDEGENGYYLSAWGTYIEVDEDDYDKLTFYVPSEEVSYNVFVASSDAVISETTTTGGALLVKDSEVTGSIAQKNLIIVGGSCINSAAATVLGFSAPACGEAFTSATGVGTGKYLIQSFNSPYASGKVALVVAGYDVAETNMAKEYLVNKKPDVAAGKKWIGSTNTVAEEVITSA